GHAPSLSGASGSSLAKAVSNRRGRACPGHPRRAACEEDVDARDKPGHDGRGESCATTDWVLTFAATTAALTARLHRHFFTIAQAGSGGPNASSPGIFARIL